MATEERNALTEMVRQAKARGETRLAKSLQADLDKDACEGAVAAGAEGAEQELPIADGDVAGSNPGAALTLTLTLNPNPNPKP
eukprot:scaffold24567_cov32-Phaeocystis_antarctica.AAC.2